MSENESPKPARVRDERLKSLTVNNLDSDLVFELKSFCAGSNFKIYEVMEIMIRRVLKEGPKMGMDIHTLRTQKRIAKKSMR